MPQRRSTPVLTILIPSALALAALACSTISLPFGGSDDPPATVPSEDIPTEATPQPTTPPEEAQSSGGPLPVAGGQCANNLLPLDVGNQWTYVQLPSPGSVGDEPTSDSEFSFTWTVVEVGQSSATMKMTSEDLPIDATYTVECEDGAILTFPTFSLNLALPGGGGGAADLAYEHASGVFLPSMQTLEGNNWDHSWQTDIVVSGQISSTPIEGQTFEITLEETLWTMAWSTVGAGPSAFESVQVQAGTFDQALPVTQEADMTFNMSFEGSSIEAQFTSTATQWFSPGVGLVKTRTEESAMNLSVFEMPDSAEDTTSILELAEFRQGVDITAE